MAMKTLLVQAKTIISVEAGSSIFVVGQGIMKKNLGSNTDAKNNQQEKRNNLLYRICSFQSLTKKIASKRMPIFLQK